METTAVRVRDTFSATGPAMYRIEFNGEAVGYRVTEGNQSTDYSDRTAAARDFNARIGF